MFSTLLLKIVPFKGYLIAAAAFAVLGVIGGQHLKIVGLERDIATLSAQYEHQRVDAAAAAIKNSEEQRAIEQQRLANQRKVEDEAERQVEVARADADAAVAAAGGLQQRYTAAVAALRRASANPGADPSGKAAEGAARMLADVQQRLDAAARQYAVVADQRGSAGLACEREYDALKP